MSKEIEKVTKPKHYHDKFDVIRFGEENFTADELKGFYRMNAMKYIARYDKKDGASDLHKAAYYLGKLTELEVTK